MTVTIGLPVFNCERTIESAIRSIFAQDFTDWRLVVVDDGSTDRTVEIARSVIDPRVTVLSDGRNHGLPYRLNQLAEFTRTPYLARMDGDDLSHPCRLGRQMAFLHANPDVDVVGTHALGIDDNDRIISLRAYHFSQDPMTVFRRRFLIHPSIVGRTEWFQKNAYDPSYSRAQDHELWIRTLPTSKYAVIPEPLYFLREVGVVSARKYSASCRMDRRIYARYGPASVGLPMTLRFLASSLAKQYVYGVASALNLGSAITRRRGTRLPAPLRDLSANALAAIHRTQLPTSSASSPGA